jgi:hypothetical protein
MRLVVLSLLIIARTVFTARERSVIAVNLEHHARSLSSSGQCGQYFGSGGSGFWSGGNCDCVNSCCFFRCDCSSSWTLNCNSGYASSSVGSVRSCGSWRDGGFFSTGPFLSSWDDGGMVCGACPPGTYGSSANQQTCTGPCAPGRWGGQAQTTSQCSGACSAGYFCPAGSSSAQGSGLCAEGYFCPAESSTSQGSGLCMAGYYCPAGSATAQGSGPCPTGTFCPQGTGTPQLCPAGTYNNATGSS